MRDLKSSSFTIQFVNNQEILVFQTPWFDIFDPDTKTYSLL